MRAVLAALVAALLYGCSEQASETGSSPRQAPASVADQAPTPEPTDTPTPRATAAERHAKREVAQTYWTRIIIASAMSDAARAMASDELKQENLVDASRLMKLAQKYSSDASDIAEKDVPPGWDDVSELAHSSAAILAGAYGSAQTAIDSQKPSDVAAALDQSDEARGKYQEAVHKARLHYIDMGGKWSDISDGRNEADGFATLVRAMASP